MKVECTHNERWSALRQTAEATFIFTATPLQVPCAFCRHATYSAARPLEVPSHHHRFLLEAIQDLFVKLCRPAKRQADVCCRFVQGHASSQGLTWCKRSTRVNAIDSPVASEVSGSSSRRRHFSSTRATKEEVGFVLLPYVGSISSISLYDSDRPRPRLHFCILSFRWAGLPEEFQEILSHAEHLEHTKHNLGDCRLHTQACPSSWSLAETGMWEHGSVKKL